MGALSGSSNALPRRIPRRTVIKMLAAGVASLPGIHCATRFPGPADPSPTPPVSATASHIVVPGLAGDGATPSVGLREKIGLMVMTGFVGQSVTPGSYVATDIAEHINGVVLFDHDVAPGIPRNIASPDQLRALTTQLKEMGQRKLLIAVDQEGGAVARLSPRNGFPATRSAAELGIVNDDFVTHSAALAIADTLLSTGISLNFAPVVDVNVNPDNPIIGRYGRSFSSDPDVVCAHAEAFVRGHRARGVLTTLKHFPGHGSSLADSHLGFTDITNTWSRRELLPFARLIQNDFADLVMIGHLYNANLDGEDPASLSHATVTGLLRDELGYSGVVISDSLGMAAITDHYSFEDAIYKAIDAGVDILLYASDLVPGVNTARRAVDHIELLVHRGTVSEARIQASYRRIMGLLSSR